jgi:hypothetical protein
MKALVAGVCVVLVVAIAMPATAGDPLRQQLAALKRQVASLKTKLAKSERDARTSGKLLQAREADISLLRTVVARTTQCPVTTPNQIAPAGASKSEVWYGNSRLAIALWTKGVVVPSDGNRLKDGALDVKYGWWRGMDGTVVVRGRRLDATSPGFTTEGLDGYGERGFQPSGIAYPTPGCWEITGSVGDASLTVTQLVVG